jgi:hypothetical protein
MALAIYTSAAFSTAAGVAVAPSASIEVRLDGSGGGALAAIFSDEAGTVPLTNPFNADSLGQFSFYVAGRAGGYQVKSTFNAEVKTVRNQAIGTAAQLDATTVGSALIGAANEASARTTLQLDVVLNSLYGTL